jgi:hypothetical protein
MKGQEDSKFESKPLRKRSPKRLFDKLSTLESSVTNSKTAIIWVIESDSINDNINENKVGFRWSIKLE